MGYSASTVAEQIVGAVQDLQCTILGIYKYFAEELVATPLLTLYTIPVVSEGHSH
jgi:hypothetical protein